MATVNTTQKKSSFLGGGLGVILALIFGGAIFFLIKSVMALKSGGTQQAPDGTYHDVHITLFDTGWIWFSVGLFVIGIIVYFMMKSDK